MKTQLKLLFSFSEFWHKVSKLLQQEIMHRLLSYKMNTYLNFDNTTVIR